MIKTKTNNLLNIKSGKVILSMVLLLFTFSFAAQVPPLNPVSYIQLYSAEAINQMITYKIPASVILAQAIFESSSGNSFLAKKSNNHFGIKCHTEWGGDTILKDDDDLNECFRKYKSVEDSYTDHSMFLKSRGRYANLFKLPVSDYKGWCYGLKTSGYATYYAYAQELIKIIEDYKLYEYDGAEKMQAITYVNSNDENLMNNNFSLDYITLIDFAKSDALFNEERDVLIQSLNLILEDDITEMAENYRYCKPKVSDGTYDV